MHIKLVAAERFWRREFRPTLRRTDRNQMTPSEFQARTRVYRNRTAIAALTLLCSLIGLAALGTWASEWLALNWLLSIMIVVPVYLMVVTLEYPSRLARRLGLACPHCGALTSGSLRPSVLSEGRCRKCAKSLYDDPA
jgi:hypothetical protein